MPGDNVAGLEPLDLVDRRAPRSEVALDRGLRQVHVDAVVDHVTGDDELEVRDVQDCGGLAVGVADLDDHGSCPSSVKRLSGAVTAVTGVGGIPV